MKKDAVLLESLHSKFVEGAVANGENRNDLEKFWEDLMEFARYAFNSAHAYSYGHLTYYTAWLKTHYPTEFYASIISNEEDPDKHRIYMEDARKNGIEILPPDINVSDVSFVTKDSNIVYGFSGIKGIGEAIYNQLTNLRPYYSMSDFLIKTYLYGLRFNKKVYDALIKSGALDCFGFKRSVMIANYERFISDFDPDQSLKKAFVANKREMTPEVKERIRGFNSKQEEYFIDESISEYSLLDILDMESEILGVHISGEPFDLVMNAVKEQHYTIDQIESIVNENGSFSGSVVVKVGNNRDWKTKTGAKMLFMDGTDHRGRLQSMTIFANNYEKIRHKIRNGSFLLLFVSCKHSYKGDGSIDYVINGAHDLAEDMKTASAKMVKSKLIKEAIVKHKGMPTSVRIKSMLNKLESFCGEVDISLATGTINLEIELEGKLKMTIGPFYVEKIDVDMIRNLNSLPNVTIETR